MQRTGFLPEPPAEFNAWILASRTTPLGLDNDQGIDPEFAPGRSLQGEVIFAIAVQLLRDGVFR